MLERIERSQTSHSRGYDSYDQTNPYKIFRPTHLIEGYFFFIEDQLYYVRQEKEEAPYFAPSLYSAVERAHFGESVKVGNLSNFKVAPHFIYQNLLFHSQQDKVKFEEEIQKYFKDKNTKEKLFTLKNRTKEELPNKIYLKEGKVYINIDQKETLDRILQATDVFWEDIISFNPNAEQELQQLLIEDGFTTLTLGDVNSFCMEKASSIPKQYFGSIEDFEYWNNLRKKNEGVKNQEIEDLRKTIIEQGEIKNMGQVKVIPKLNENVFISYEFPSANLNDLKVNINIGSPQFVNQNIKGVLTEELQHKIETILLFKLEEWDFALLQDKFYFFQNIKQFSRDIPGENTSLGKHLPSQISLDYSLLSQMESNLFKDQVRKNALRLEEEFKLKPVNIDYDKLVEQIVQLDKEFNQISFIEHYSNQIALSLVYNFVYLYNTLTDIRGGGYDTDQLIIDLEFEKLNELQKIQKHAPSLEKLKTVYAQKTGNETALVTVLKQRMYHKGFLLNYLFGDTEFSANNIDVLKIGNSIYSKANKAYYELNNITLPDQGPINYDTQKYKDYSKGIILSRARKEIQKELDHLNQNPKKLQGLDEYFISNYDESLKVFLERTQIWNDDIILPGNDFQYEWITLDWKDHSIYNQEEFDKAEVEKEANLRGWLVQDENKRYRYKLGEGDTIASVAKHLEVKIENLQSVNKLSADKKYLPTGVKYQEKAGNFLLLPADYAPSEGQEFFQVINATTTTKEYRKVERVKGKWTDNLYLNYGKQSSLYNAFIRHFPKKFFTDSLHTNAMELDFNIQITPFIVAYLRIGFGYGQNLSLGKGDDRKVAVRLSHSIVAVLKTATPSSQFGGRMEIGKEFSSGAFDTLNGSYDTYEHFFANLQLEIFKKFGSSASNDDVENLLLNPSLWDDNVKKTLEKGYTRTHIEDNTFARANLNFPGNVFSIAGEGVTEEQSSSKIRGLKSSDFRKGKGHLKFRTDQHPTKESKQKNSTTQYEIDVSGFDHKIGVNGVYQNNDFHSNKDNMGEYLSLTFYGQPDLSISAILANKEGIVQDLASTSTNLVSGYKEIAPENRNLMMGSELTKYLSRHFSKLQKGKGGKMNASGYLKFTLQLIFEDSGLNIQYLRVSVGGNLDAEVDAAFISLEGGAKIEKELFEISGNETLSYVSTVFNAIALKEQKKSEEQTTLTKAIQALSKNVVNEKGKPKKNTIPTTTKFLKTYGRQRENTHFKFIKQQLFDNSYSHWQEHLIKNPDFKVNTNEQIQLITETIQKGFAALKTKGFNAESATWKGMGVQWLSEEQCKFYLGDLKDILIAYQLNPNAEINDGMASGFLREILNPKGTLLPVIKRKFFEDILFPLYIENQIHETLTYNNF